MLCRFSIPVVLLPDSTTLSASIISSLVVGLGWGGVPSCRFLVDCSATVSVAAGSSVLILRASIIKSSLVGLV